MVKNFLPEDFNKLQLPFFTGYFTAEKLPISQVAAILTLWHMFEAWQTKVSLGAYGCWSAIHLEIVVSPLHKETALSVFATISFHSFDKRLVFFS